MFARIKAEKTRSSVTLLSAQVLRCCAPGRPGALASAASSATQDGPRRERQRRAWEEGRKVTPIPRPGGSRRASFPEHVRAGRSQATGQGGDTPPAQLRAPRPSEAVSGPGLGAPRALVPGPPERKRRLRRGEGGSGRRGGRWGRGIARPKPRAVTQLLSSRPPGGPRALATALPARAASGGGRAKPGPGPRREDRAEGPAPSSAHRAAAREASGALAVTYLWKPRHGGRALPLGHARPGAPLPGARSVCFARLLSLSHSKIGQGVEVTPGTAPGSYAKAALPPGLRESVGNYSVP